MAPAPRDIFREIYKRNFVYDKPADRALLQATVYLLRVCGMRIGKYSFRLEPDGPFSVELLCKMYEDNQKRRTDTVYFARYEKITFEKIRDIVNENPKKNVVSDNEWLSLVASLHYLMHCHWTTRKLNKDIIGKTCRFLYLDVLYNSAYQTAKNLD